VISNRVTFRFGAVARPYSTAGYGNSTATHQNPDQAPLDIEDPQVLIKPLVPILYLESLTRFRNQVSFVVYFDLNELSVTPPSIFLSTPLHFLPLTLLQQELSTAPPRFEKTVPPPKDDAEHQAVQKKENDEHDRKVKQQRKGLNHGDQETIRQYSAGCD
jgi:hypothetical protein